MEREEAEEEQLADLIPLNSMQKKIIDGIEDPADQLIIKEILLMMREKQFEEDMHDQMEDIFLNEEAEAQGVDGPVGTSEKPQTREEAKYMEKIVTLLEERYRNEYGYDLFDIEDEDEFKEAYVEYFKKNVLKKKKQKKRKSPEDIEHEKMYKEDAIYK